MCIRDRQSTWASKSIHYSIAISVIVSIQIFATIKIIRNLLENESFHQRYSLITVGFCSCSDAYLCFFHCMVASLVRRNLLHFFFLPILLYFILCGVFEFRLLAFIWKERYLVHFRSTEEIKRGIAIFYFKFLFGFFLYLGLMLFMSHTSLVSVFLSSAFLVPQIVHTAMHGRRLPLDKTYIFAYIVPRIFLLLYFKCCPENIMRKTPQPDMLFWIIGFMAAQITIVYLQHLFGPRCIVPPCLLPHQHNYFVKVEFTVDPNNPCLTDDCIICLHPLYKDPPKPVEKGLVTVEETLKPDFDPKDALVKKVKNKVMKTPCNHMYHVHCLTSWMSIKHECPSCRAILPTY
eukprot:TRINITY_DN1308_c0_g1_i4.p1 TRINITY_DN1308_c0_g1~~TRINITY_DN1308_c0_g1_i4.p1  ORF type:complete len:347 (+),score=37.33 TRINITY_DN1308_c0_g1_i4:66-1106(+)